ncbi:MAG: SUMF1/EgtB/PvdO family nonheme iron enzyme [Planctomycetota bacterium]
MGQERRAILIGSSQFPADLKLTPLRCPENDVEGLSKLLCSEAHGRYREVVPLKNKAHYEVLKTVNVALKQAKKDDFVLIYYSGHGKLDRAGRLYLAASNTEVEALESTSIPVATILDYVRLSNCRSVGLILDCCYSGAVGGSIFRGGVEEQLQQASSSGGIYILTASTGVQVAEEKEKDEYGLLTKYIIQGIESGEADLKQDGNISMDELYEYVHGKVQQEGFQEPMKWDLGVTGELIVAGSGKMPREERRKQIRQIMLDYAREGQISDRLLSQALEVLKLRPDELRGEPRKRDDLLTQLFDKRLPLGEFVDQWNVLAWGGPDVPPRPPPPPPPPWWRRHFRTIATVSVPVVALVGWLVVSPPSNKPTPPPHVEQTTPPPSVTVPKGKAPKPAEKSVSESRQPSSETGQAPKPRQPPHVEEKTAPLSVTAQEAEAREAGAVKTNPNDGQRYVWIPPGEFQMGCSPGDNECYTDEKPVHTVRISRGFWLGQTEVTQAAYQKVMGANPSRFKGPQHPVETINWNEARKYCEAVGGRLPTEAEWEYAARVASQEARYGELDKIAWYARNSGGQTQPVGQKQKNAWGLHDVLGNVWEWVSDWYQEDYYKTLPSPAVDPKGPLSGKMRVLRGGSWGYDPRDVRASVRGRLVPENRYTYIGFRCAREVIP